LEKITDHQGIWNGICSLSPAKRGGAEMEDNKSMGREKRSYKACLPLAIVGGIILVLAAISIPNFLSFCARAKQSEAKQNLGAIYSAYQQYHSDHHTYPSSPSIQIGSTTVNCFAIAGWEPKGQIRYNYNCMNTEAFSPAFNDSPCPGDYSHADKDSFTIASCGNVDADTTVDVWTINDRKKLKNVVDDVRK
jgi:type IV pilus assembly protein PilA